MAANHSKQVKKPTLPNFDGPLQRCGFCGELMWMRGRCWRHAKQRVRVTFLPAVWFFPVIKQLPLTSAALADLGEALKALAGRDAGAPSGPR